MQQDRELASDGDRGSLLGRLAAAGCESQSVATQIAVGSEWADDPMRALHEQSAQPWIASLADAQLRVAVAGRLAARAEAEPRAYRAAAAEALRILHREHERHRDRGADAVDLLEVIHLGVVVLGDPGKALVEGADLCGQLGDQREDRRQRRLQQLGDQLGDARREAAGRRRWQPHAERLADATHLLHRHRPYAHHQVASSHDRQMGLRLLAAMAHVAEQLGHRGAHLRQHLGITPVGLARVLGDQLYSQ